MGAGFGDRFTAGGTRVGLTHLGAETKANRNPEGFRVEKKTEVRNGDRMEPGACFPRCHSSQSCPLTIVRSELKEFAISVVDDRRVKISLLTREGERKWKKCLPPRLSVQCTQGGLSPCRKHSPDQMLGTPYGREKCGQCHIHSPANTKTTFVHWQRCLNPLTISEMNVQSRLQDMTQSFVIFRQQGMVVDRATAKSM